MRRNLFISLLIVFSLLGCKRDALQFVCGDERPAKLIFVNGFYVDNNSSIHIRYKKNSKPNIHQYAKLDANASIWEHLSNNNFKTSDIKARFLNNHVKVTQNGDLLFEKYLPTIDDISISTNKELSPKEITYTTYRDKIDFGWDMKTYIASIYSKDKKLIYYFAIEDKDNYFKIYLIDSSPSSNAERLYYDNEYNFMRARYDYDYDYSRSTVFSISTNNKATFCYGHNTEDIRCLVKDKNNTIISQKLFGEIYPIEYQDIYRDIALDGAMRLKKYRTVVLTPSGSMIFDNNDNMHLFYNDVHNITGNYFMYRMYSKDNPTTPLYEQKIPWR